MSKLGLLRASIRSTLAVRASILLESPRCFSTAAEQPPPKPPTLDATVNQFIRMPYTGGAAVYGKLVGAITRNTLKTDVVNLLQGCNLALEDVKVQYNPAFSPMGILVQFPSQADYENAFRVIRSRGLSQVFRLQTLDRQWWDVMPPYDGKTVLIEGIPRTALLEDVERFLSGAPYKASSIKLFMRPGAIRVATVDFPSPIQAMNAYITKNKGFIHNDQILMRVLQ